MYHNELFAGFSAALLSNAILHPLDMMKVHQIDSRSSSILQSLRYLWHTGLLYRTLPINTLAYSLNYSIYFPLYNYIKDRFQCQPIWATIPASMLSMTFINPLWVLKNVQSTCVPVKSIVETVKYVYQQGGLMGFQSGLIFGYINNLNGVINFSIYETLKLRHTSEPPTNVHIMLYALLARTTSTLICFPILALRTRQQIEQTSYCATLSALKKEPLRRLYNGILPNLLQQLPKNVLLLVLYENLLLYVFTKPESR